MAGFADFANILTKFSDIQNNMKAMQEKLGQKVVEGASGGGMVTAKINGRFEVLEIKIDREAVDPNDLEMLEDLVKAAVNAAVLKNQEEMKQEMANATAGLNIPGLSDKLGSMLGL